MTIRSFYDFMNRQQLLTIPNPVAGGSLLRLPQPLPRHLSDQDVIRLLRVVDDLRDRAMILLMLRSGLRVSEVANLTVNAVDWRRRKLLVFEGKGRKDRMVYISNDTLQALVVYMKKRRIGREKKMFLVQRGRYSGRPISVRGIQKRLEFYARVLGRKISCHHLRHTMATQLLNADAPLVSIQELMGHARIKTTQRYGRVSNTKVQRDYQNAMAEVMRRASRTPKLNDEYS